VTRVLVCIPTYDERDNLPETLRRLRQAVPEADVLVIDDASPDGTGVIAEELAATDPQVQVLHRAGKAGLGAAYVAGFAWGLDRGYEVLVEMDADGSHLPEELPRLLAALHDADVVLGSRWMPGGEVRNWPRSRLVLSRGGNAYVRAALGMPLTDATGGFRAYRAEVLRSLALGTVSSQGYCFQVDLVWQAWRAGRRVIEVPITFVERARGKSKMSRDIVAEALWRVTWWGVTSRRGHSSARRPTSSARAVRLPLPVGFTPRDGDAPSAGGGRDGQDRPDTPGSGTDVVSPAGR
jgi:glycosyltransferase involved in cell wall biosynthesis